MADETPLDATTFATMRLQPVIDLDASLEAAIPLEVQAQRALTTVIGWSEPYSEAQELYIGLYAVQGLIPRVLARFSVRLHRVGAGPASIEYQKAIDFLKEMAAQIDEQIQHARKELTPGDLSDAPVAQIPVVGWRAP